MTLQLISARLLKESQNLDDTVILEPYPWFESLILIYFWTCWSSSLLTLYNQWSVFQENGNLWRRGLWGWSRGGASPRTWEDDIFWKWPTRQVGDQCYFNNEVWQCGCDNVAVHCDNATHLAGLWFLVLWVREVWQCGCSQIKLRGQLGRGSAQWWRMHEVQVNLSDLDWSSWRYPCLNHRHKPKTI